MSVLERRLPQVKKFRRNNPLERSGDLPMLHPAPSLGQDNAHRDKRTRSSDPGCVLAPADGLLLEPASVHESM
jgi:hypothetical protein